MSRSICLLLALSGAACFQLPARTAAPSRAPHMSRPRPTIYAAEDDYDDEMRERMRVRARHAPLPIKPHAPPAALACRRVISDPPASRLGRKLRPIPPH